MDTEQVSQDAFDQLEERVQRAVTQTVELRAENARLKQQIEALELRALEAEAASEDASRTRASVTRLEGELSTLQKERENVRTRVERLLKQIDTLAAS